MAGKAMNRLKRTRFGMLLSMACVMALPVFAQAKDAGQGAADGKSANANAPSSAGAEGADGARTQASDASNDERPTDNSQTADGNQPATTNDQPTRMAGGDASTFSKVVSRQEARLQAKLEELNRLRERISDQKVPLTERLNELENRKSELEATYESIARELDNATLRRANLKEPMEQRRRQIRDVTNVLNEYIRNFETRIHIAELQRYEGEINEAKRAFEVDASLEELFEQQSPLIGTSVERLNEALGGARFEGRAVAGDDGVQKEGRFFLMGPAALFLSDDGEVVGAAEQVLNSPEPTVIAFKDPADAEAARALVAGEDGRFPLDPTLGEAHEMASTEETLWEHIQKGGPVMVPIFALAAVSLLVALYKWVGLSLFRKPSRPRVRELIAAVERGEADKAQATAKGLKGQIGRMLEAGVAHLNYPRELIEEVMYERVLSTKLKLQRLLPFIAITAAAAPLLGLLGTVTGIISTFKMITVKGTGDVQVLSGGISEALVTTEFGLIVAIPSLLLHAFLSRKAKGLVNDMEKSAVALVNAVGKSPLASEKPATATAGAAAGETPEPRVTADMETAMANLEKKLSGQDREAIGAALERLNHSAVELMRAACAAAPAGANGAQSHEPDESSAAEATSSATDASASSH